MLLPPSLLLLVCVLLGLLLTELLNSRTGLLVVLDERACLDSPAPDQLHAHRAVQEVRLADRLV